MALTTPYLRFSGDNPANVEAAGVFTTIDNSGTSETTQAAASLAGTTTSDTTKFNRRVFRTTVSTNLRTAALAKALLCNRFHNGTDSLTYQASFRLVNVASTYVLVSTGLTAVSSVGIDIRASGPALGIYVANGSGVSFAATNTNITTLLANADYDLAYRKTATSIQIWLNGVLIYSATLSSPSAADSSQPASYWGYTAGATASPVAWLKEVVVHQSALSDAELAEWRTEFKRFTTPAPFVAQAEVSEVYEASGTIAQNNALVAQGEVSAVYEASGTLQQNHMLEATGEVSEVYEASGTLLQTHSMIAQGEVSEVYEASGTLLQTHSMIAQGEVSEVYERPGKIRIGPPHHVANDAFRVKGRQNVFHVRK